MKSVFAILGIVLAGVIFFVFTKPTYDSVQATQSQIDQYNQALDKAEQLQSLKQTLLSRYNSFNPTDLDRLQTMLPTQVDNIGLVLDLDTLANQYGMSLENVNITSPSANSADAAIGTQTANPNSYQALDVQFTVPGTYSQFEQYVTALEQSLRIVDLVHLSISSVAQGSPNGSSGSIGSTSTSAGSTASDQNVYTFDVTLQTYWLQ